MMSLSYDSQNLSANQIHSRYLTLRLRYNYFGFRNSTSGILLLISILTILPQSACHFAPVYRSSIETYCSVLRKSRFCILATDRETDRQTEPFTDASLPAQREKLQLSTTVAGPGSVCVSRRLGMTRLTADTDRLNRYFVWKHECVKRVFFTVAVFCYTVVG